jgi:uncharacterized protein (DUF58 family)
LLGFVPQDFYYSLNWRARGTQPGGHTTRMPGGSLDFRGYVPFMQNPDPRRIDIRATLRSIPRNLMSRAFYERGAVDVVAVLDLSASMGFSGAGNKLQQAADIAASIAWSAVRQGDNFSLIVCDDEIRKDLIMPASHRQGLAQEAHRIVSLATIRGGARASALMQAVEHMRKKRALVFLLSDFHFEEQFMLAALNSLAAHDVVPLVLWDSAEYQDIPEWGWARVRDMESPDIGSLFMRRSMAARIRHAYLQRRQQIADICRQTGARTPFFSGNHFNAEQLSRHLLEGC